MFHGSFLHRSTKIDSRLILPRGWKYWEPTRAKHFKNTCATGLQKSQRRLLPKSASVSEKQLVTRSHHSQWSLQPCQKCTVRDTVGQYQLLHQTCWADWQRLGFACTVHWEMRLSHRGAWTSRRGKEEEVDSTHRWKSSKRPDHHLAAERTSLRGQQRSQRNRGETMPWNMAWFLFQHTSAMLEESSSSGSHWWSLESLWCLRTSNPMSFPGPEADWTVCMLHSWPPHWRLQIGCSLRKLGKYGATWAVKQPWF